MSGEEFFLSALAGAASLALWSFVLRSQVARFRVYSGRRQDDRYEVEFTVPLWVMSALWLGAIILSVVVDLDTFGNIMRLLLLIGPIGLFLGVAALAAMQEWSRSRA